MILKRIFLTLLLTIGCILSAWSMESSQKEFDDSICVEELYEVNDGELQFQTEEETVQVHDSIPVYRNKMQVEYTIKASKGKITIKRHVLSSEDTTLCEDRNIQALYPNVTPTVLSGILTPRKIKNDPENAYILDCCIKDEGETRTLTIDKLAGHPMKADSFMGVTVEFLSATEKLFYRSQERCNLQNLNAIQSECTMELTGKQDDKHRIQVVEDITLKF